MRKMIKKIKQGLTGIIIGTAILNSNLNAQSRIEQTISDVKLSETKSKSNYELIGTVYFDNPGKNNDKGFYHKYNEEMSEEELNFGLIPEEESWIREDYNGNIKLIPKNSLYIPEVVKNDSGEILTTIELNNLDAKIKRKLKNKSRKTSRNNEGYTYKQFGKDLKSSFPSEIIEGQEYNYFNLKTGNFVDEKTKYINIYSKDLQDFVLVPTNSLYWDTNPKTGEIRIHSEEGFYRPKLENSKVNMIYSPTSRNKTIQKQNTNIKGINKIKTRRYVVLEGDTYSSISKKLYGTTEYWDELYKDLNPETEPRKLRVGQSIKVF